MVENSYDKDCIAISPRLGQLLHKLKKFNDKHIYKSQEAEGYKIQAEKTIEYLFDDLLLEIKRTKRFQSQRYPEPDKDGSIPTVYRVLQNFVLKDMKDVYSSKDSDELIILDFIAGMTDSFAIRSVSDVFIPKSTV